MSAASPGRPGSAVAPRFEASSRDYAYDPRGPIEPAGVAPSDWAEEYHEASKMHAAFPSASLGPAGQELITSATARLALGRKALAFTGPATALPPPLSLDTDLVDLARRRRSGLPDECGEVTLEQLSAVLACSAATVPGRPEQRVNPSAGALYPLDVIVVARRVTGVAAGAYLYDPLDHRLLPRVDVDPDRFHQEVGENLIVPPLPAVTLAVVATFARSRTKYALRGYRFALLEAGHVAHAALLAATAAGLHTQPWGGFIDDAANRHLELDGVERACLYLVALSGGTT